jgi:hypothetical protein
VATINIDVQRFKGSYPFDAGEPMLAIEWRWIKKISGYLPLTIGDGFAGQDPDLYIALSVVAMHRAGKIRREEALAVADLLADAPVDGKAIEFVFDEEDEQQDPPV